MSCCRNSPILTKLWSSAPRACTPHTMHECSSPKAPLITSYIWHLSDLYFLLSQAQDIWYVLYCSKLLSLQSPTLISEILIQSWESNCIREAHWFVHENFEKGLQLSISSSTLISRNSLEVGHEGWRKVRFQIWYLNGIVKFYSSCSQILLQFMGHIYGYV
jgi:hypothetical protein